MALKVDITKQCSFLLCREDAENSFIAEGVTGLEGCEGAADGRSCVG